MEEKKDWLCIGPYKFPELDVNSNHSVAKTVLRGEVPHSTRGDPVDAERYVSRPEGQ